MKIERESIHEISIHHKYRQRHAAYNTVHIDPRVPVYFRTNKSELAYFARSKHATAGAVDPTFDHPTPADLHNRTIKRNVLVRISYLRMYNAVY